MPGEGHCPGGGCEHKTVKDKCLNSGSILKNVGRRSHLTLLTALSFVGGYFWI